MPSKQSQQLLDTIDSVLAECSKDPRRAGPRPQPTRPPWRPTWVQDGQGTDQHGHNGEAQSSSS